MTTYIYARVSSTNDRQSTDRQVKALTEQAKLMGYDVAGIYEEHISGATRNKERMKTSVVEFYFVKKDGTLRHAFGTTMPSLAAKHINGRGIPRESVKTTPFFCVESGEWRSFRWESILKVC